MNIHFAQAPIFCGTTLIIEKNPIDISAPISNDLTTSFKSNKNGTYIQQTNSLISRIQ